MDRIVIIGNSGSGKSYLAAQLGGKLAIPVVSLDRLFWEPGGFDLKRSPAAVHQDIESIKPTRQWIVEGVFGELAARFLDRAECLIWLDMDWASCHSNLLHRGSESAKQLDPEQAEVKFQKLLAWASHYWDREDMRSHRGHQQLFDTFTGYKRVLRSRTDMDDVIGDPAILKSSPL
jgi:adenylate kinase family enzyme